MLKEHNIKLFAFTNQPGISSGEATKNEFINELTSFGFDDFCICPHHHTTGCTCRKPSIGMLIEAARKHQLDLSKCVIIGDRWTDIEAGRKVGATTILV
ncbi:HAD-IIIA family hydrolase [Priestia flexa]|nr:HAD-IIIA family hydrolase [Priestia flexa]